MYGVDVSGLPLPSFISAVPAPVPTNPSVIAYQATKIYVPHRLPQGNV